MSNQVPSGSKIATATSADDDKRPLISNLVSSGSSDGNGTEQNKPVIKPTSSKNESMMNKDKAKIPQPPAMPTMVPSAYYGHYPDYYQYYNQFSSYYQQLPPISAPATGPTQADMIHAYNSYLYQNYSNHKGLNYYQKQQQAAQQLQQQQYLQQQQQQQQQQQYQQANQQRRASQSTKQDQNVGQPAQQPHSQPAQQPIQLPLAQQQAHENQSAQEAARSDQEDSVEAVETVLPPESASPSAIKTEPEDDSRNVTSKHKREDDTLKSRPNTVVFDKVRKPVTRAKPEKLNTEFGKALFNPMPSVLPPAQNTPSSMRPYTCTEPDCTWAFARMSDLKRHTKSHQPPQFQCPYWRNDPTCHRNGGAFNRLDVLKRHLKLVHFVHDKGKGLFPAKPKSEHGWCRSCQGQFNNVKDFLLHVDDCSAKLNPTEWKQHYDNATGKESESPNDPNYARSSSSLSNADS